MLKRVPNARQLAEIILDGNYLYSSGQEIAVAHFKKTRCLCTAKEIDDRIQSLNAQVLCFDGIDVGGQKKYLLVYYLRWYPQSTTVRRKSPQWLEQYQDKCNDPINGNFDIFYHEWTMGGHGCPILYRACCNAINDVHFFEFWVNRLYRLVEWAQSSPDDVASAMQRAVDKAWLVRQKREHVIPTVEQKFEGGTPAFMTWMEFLKRIVSFTANRVTMEKSYLLMWFDHPKMTEMFEKTKAEIIGPGAERSSNG